jgi:UDP-glucuronate decarboxylase
MTVKQRKYHSTKRILVAGGAGFIGSHLIQKMISDGNEVICLDNFFTGSKDNIRGLLKNEKFELIRHDVNEKVNFQVDEIFNLACPASPLHYQYNSIKTFQTSINGALNLLNNALEVNAKILQASTSEIYGDPLVHPQQEDYWGNVNTIGPRSCYDEGKRGAETIFNDFYKAHDIDIRIARIFNTYGPNMHPNDGRVVSNFVMQALANDDITLFGDGSQTRSFCFVTDMVAGLLRLMETGSPKGVINSPFNIGNSDEITIKTLAEKIIALTGSRSKIRYEKLPQDDPTMRCPDITKAQKFLSWEPKVSLNDGLKETIDYFRFLLKN